MKARKDVHIGREIERVLHERGITVTEFANRICCHRKNVYDIFTRKSIDIDANDINAAWVIASEEDTQLGLSFASAEDPVDATYMILDPNFGRNNRNQSAWQGTGLKKGGDNTNMNTESYMAVFDLSQTLTGVPNGIYKVEAQAAVTFHDNRTIKEYDGNGSPVVYANSVTSDFVEMTTADKLSSQTQLSTSFNAGSYQVEPIYVEVTDGTLGEERLHLRFGTGSG